MVFFLSVRPQKNGQNNDVLGVMRLSIKQARTLRESTTHQFPDSISESHHPCDSDELGFTPKPKLVIRTAPTPRRRLSPSRIDRFRPLRDGDPPFFSSFNRRKEPLSTEISGFVLQRFAAESLNPMTHVRLAVDVHGRPMRGETAGGWGSEVARDRYLLRTRCGRGRLEKRILGRGATVARADHASEKVGENRVLADEGHALKAGPRYRPRCGSTPHRQRS